MTIKTKNQDWMKILPGVIVSLLALAVLLYFVDLKRFVQALRMADFRFVLMIFVNSLIFLFIRAIVWRTLLQEKASYSQVFVTLNEGYLLNNVLPFRLGEIGRAFLLGRKANLPFFEVFSTIFVERVLDIAMAAGLLLFSLGFVVGASWANQAALAALGMVALGIFVLFLLARYSDWTVQMFERLTHRWPSLSAMGSQQLHAFLSGLAVFKDGRRFLRVIFWMVVNWLAIVLQYYCILRAYYPQVEWIWLPFTIGVVALGAAAPSSPGAVGVLELSMVGALSVFGLDPSVALAAAVTAHLINYLVTGSIGVYGLTRDGLTLTGLYKNVRSISAENPPQ
jgi:glycosyltransferase 2 family protein